VNAEEENCPDVMQQLNLQCVLYFGAMNLALGALANTQPAWLSAIILPVWYPRYAGLHSRLSIPRGFQQCQLFINTISEDILYLMEMIEKSGDESLISIPEIANLRKIQEVLKTTKFLKYQAV
jgi:hypothetical protein